MANYIVIDLEMCEVPRGYKRQRLNNLSHEVIQIGAVLVDGQMNISDSFRTFVKPREGMINRRIHKLTGISGSDLVGAPDIALALEKLAAWAPEDSVIVSWSESDLKQLKRELEAKNLHIPAFEPYFDSWVDCQKTFSEKMDTDKVYRLSEALSITDIFYDEDMHNALTDAANTAQLYVRMMSEEKLTLSSYYTSSDSERGDGLLGAYSYVV